jgi:hypothetical protein
MPDLVNVYNGADRNYALDVSEQLRVKTYGADFGENASFAAMTVLQWIVTVSSTLRA